jgi:hypothetical protein
LKVARGSDQDEAGDAVGAGERHLLGDVSAAGLSHQHSRGDTDRIHESHDVLGEVFKGIAHFGLWSTSPLLTAASGRPSAGSCAGRDAVRYLLDFIPWHSCCKRAGRRSS